MQGSVLVVKADLLDNHPDVVESLVKVSQKATDWIVQHPDQAAAAISRQLNAVGSSLLPYTIADVMFGMEITPGLLRRSMGRLEYTTDIDPTAVQVTIDYLAKLGYIRSQFDAGEILDLRFVE